MYSSLNSSFKQAIFTVCTFPVSSLITYSVTLYAFPMFNQDLPAAYSTRATLSRTIFTRPGEAGIRLPGRCKMASSYQFIFYPASAYQTYRTAPFQTCQSPQSSTGSFPAQHPDE